MSVFILQMHHPIQMKPADSENRNGKFIYFLDKEVIRAWFGFGKLQKPISLSGDFHNAARLAGNERCFDMTSGKICFMDPVRQVFRPDGFSSISAFHSLLRKSLMFEQGLRGKSWCSVSVRARPTSYAWYPVNRFVQNVWFSNNFDKNQRKFN